MKSDELTAAGLDPEKMPRHVAMIMDGNGRWAKKRFLNRVKGHEKGSETVREIGTTCRKMGIPFLTLYAFSTENWARPKAEVSALMTLLKRFLVSEREEMVDKGIRLNIVGQKDRLPAEVRQEADVTIDATRHNRDMTLNLALSYGSRQEITHAVSAVAQKVAAGELAPEDITEDIVAAHLYTSDIPDPDLVIRTSGEFRLSNFLLWQSAYAEIYITQTLWPDFSKKEFIDILKNYQERDRRFGKVECSMPSDGSPQ